jgi:hypothetical protein
MKRNDIRLNARLGEGSVQSADGGQRMGIHSGQALHAAFPKQCGTRLAFDLREKKGEFFYAFLPQMPDRR